MLVTANVLRLRREWALAEAKCSEVLQLDPGNATAYSILGSIARDQGRLRDAIQWFRMALDRNPSNLSDRKKLEEVIDRVFSGRDQGLTGRARAAVKGGLDTVAAQARAARPTSPMFLAVWAALGVMIVAAAFALVSVRGGDLQRGSPPRQPPAGAFVTSPAVGAGRGRAPVHTAESMVPAAPRFDEGVGALEAELLSYLQKQALAMDPNCQVNAVEIDPRDGKVLLRLTMPRLWLPETMRESVIRVSQGMATAAAGWDDRISTVRVRCDMRQQGLPDRPALVVEGSARMLAEAGPGAGGER